MARWISERPGIDRDEFIDDIPFPETQNYVKKILGTAEDYRRLYGSGRRSSADDDARAGRVAPGRRPRRRRRRARPPIAERRSRRAKAPAKKKTTHQKNEESRLDLRTHGGRRAQSA